MNNENYVNGDHNADVITETTESTLAKKICEFFIVGIGSSAGGLEALESFFSCMPSANSMAFVVIQHLSPDYKSLMPEILSRNTKIKVLQIQDGMKVLPGCIYLNPPKYSVTISQGQFLLKEQEKSYRINSTINTFFNSLAVEMRERAIGIILSGTGSDGTQGCRAIKEAGGLIISQDEESAKFNGMPRSVIATNICDYILTPTKIPEKLLQYTGQTSLITINENNGQDLDHKGYDTLSQIFSIINKRHSIDFSLYKQSTVLRCLERRIRICQIPNIEAYHSYLKDNLEEVDALYNSLFIGVTRFFRDKEAFEIIKTKVIPEIINSKDDNAVIRVWVAGCCTGEEAYSLAILFKEYMDLVKRNIKLKIFATDIDNRSIEYASAGIYPDSISEDVSLERLNRYFIKKRDVYQVSKYIREMVIFSRHNVINNPPFYKIDLLTCRNLLIYFQPKLQTRILSTFQFALASQGYMFLGISETTGELKSYFSTVDGKYKIYKRRDMKKRPLVDDLSIITTGMKVVKHKGTYEEYTRNARSKWEMDEISERLLEECLPPSAIVDENGELVQVCGNCDKYLKAPRGKVVYDIQKMVPKELSTALGTAISKVKKEKTTVTYTNIKIKIGEGQTSINLIVKPLFTKNNGNLIFVQFEEIKDDAIKCNYVENYDTISKLQERITDLEQELQFTKESLQTSIEEIETSSEELQSANEELLVSNEELHSTNEELQSVNEELIVVNTQYQYKIQELADLNNDMMNYLNSTSIGTLFLDSNLYVRKFTPALTREINLIETDIGRPISHIAHNLKDEDLVKQSRVVMDSLVSFEKEVQGSDNRWYLIKYSPYRTNENVIKGVVISLVDITALKDAVAKQRSSMEHYEKLVELSPYAIMLISHGRILFSNTAGLNLLKEKKNDNLIGKPINHYLNFNEQLVTYKEIEHTKDDEIGSLVEKKVVRWDGSEIYVEIYSMPFSMGENDSDLIILRDITYKKIENKLRMENEKRQALLDEANTLDKLKNDFFSNLSHELRTPLNVIMSTLQLIDSKVKDYTEYNKTINLKKHMNVMKQNCYRQLRLVNNMIDITKIDAGFYDIKYQNHDIVNIVENITLSINNYVVNRGLELVFDTEVEEKVLACNPDSIERIMLNLLSNAIKFTGEGGSIYVNLYDRGESIIISVKDSGIGIPKDKQEVIFDRFRQVDKSLTRDNEGSGIGLSLVKSLVEMHGGKISIVSEYGKGSEFLIELPVKTVIEESVEENHEMQQQSHVEKIHLEFSDIYSL